jgi:hypothetical protein
MRLKVEKIEICKLFIAPEERHFGRKKMHFFFKAPAGRHFKYASEMLNKDML